MSYPFNKCRSEGVAYRPWAERVMDLCEGENIEPLSKQELVELYGRNMTYEEAKLYARFKDVTNVWMELHINDSIWVHVERFQTSSIAKEFFNKFP